MKQKKSEAKVIAAEKVKIGDKHSKFTFEHRPYTYKGFPEPNFGQSFCKLEIGAKYFVVDSECESHYIADLMTLKGFCNIKKEFKTKVRLVFLDDQNIYWLAKVKVRICPYDKVIIMEIYGKEIGEELPKKIVVKKEISETLKLI